MMLRLLDSLKTYAHITSIYEEIMSKDYFTSDTNISREKHTILSKEISLLQNEEKGNFINFSFEPNLKYRSYTLYYIYRLSVCYFYMNILLKIVCLLKNKKSRELNLVVIFLYCVTIKAFKSLSLSVLKD